MFVHFETKSHDHTELIELVAHLPKPPKCWDYRYVSPHPYLFFEIVFTIVVIIIFVGKEFEIKVS